MAPKTKEAHMQFPLTLSPRLVKSAAAFAFSACLAWAQPAVELPRASPMASVSQTFGYTTATVTYSRPVVNGRVIWGSLVPYGKVWRAGANEATVLELTTDARLNGHALPKGRYGLFILPAEREWTFILSKISKTWGAFTYDQKDDALRITVPNQPAGHLERLEYGFENLSDSGATLVAHWEKLKASIDIRVEFLETGIARIKDGLPKAKPDDQFAYMNAAKFYWTYNVDRKQALEWIDKSIRIKPVYNNLWAKAEMLVSDNKITDAKKFAKLARDAAAKNPADAGAVAMIDKAVATWGGH